MDLTLSDMETRMINHAIEKHNGNLSAAADRWVSPGKHSITKSKNPGND